MKKIILTVIIIVIGNNVYAQKNEISLGIVGNADNFLTQYAPKNNWLSFEHAYSEFYSLSLGGQLNFQKGKTGLRTAVLYSRKGYNFNYEWFAPDGSDGTGDPAIPLKIKYRLYYIDLPIGIYYQVINKKKYHLSPSIGIMNSLNIGNSGIILMGDGSKNDANYDTSGINSYLFGVRLGLINNVDFHESIFFSFEPYINYNLTEFGDTNIESSNFSFGGNISINYKLN